MTIYEQAYLVRTIHDKVSDVYLRDRKLSDLLDQVDEDLEGGEVMLNLM